MTKNYISISYSHLFYSMIIEYSMPGSMPDVEDTNMLKFLSSLCIKYKFFTRESMQCSCFYTSLFTKDLGSLSFHAPTMMQEKDDVSSFKIQIRCLLCLETFSVSQALLLWAPIWALGDTSIKTPVIPLCNDLLSIYLPDSMCVPEGSGTAIFNFVSQQPSRVSSTQ